MNALRIAGLMLLGMAATTASGQTHDEVRVIFSQYVQQYWEIARPYLAHAQYCAVNEVLTPECRNFWTTVMHACFTLGGLLAIPTAASLIKERLALRSARKHLESHAIFAGETASEKAKSEGADAADPDITHEEYAAMMREHTHAHSRPAL